MALYHLIYVSSARAELAAEDLQRVLESAFHHNTPQQVTGMLLYLDGCFMQVLEGEETAVDGTYARILKDPRHTGVMLVERAPIGKRSFGRWTMGFRQLQGSDVADHPAFAPFFSDGFSAASIGAEPGLALDILKQFAQTQRA